mgnify:CR=1 FL=1
MYLDTRSMDLFTYKVKDVTHYMNAYILFFGNIVVLKLPVRGRSLKNIVVIHASRGCAYTGKPATTKR